MGEFKIGGRKIGINEPTYFIADIAANHDGDLKRAQDLIFLAADAGADVAKFQNFQAPKIVSQYGFDQLCDKLSHQATWKKSVFEVYEDASVSQEWTAILKETCMKANIEYFTSPYDFESVDHIDPFVNVYKIGSGDITWLEMIEYMAKKNKPIIIASGASDLDDVKRAMTVLQKYTQDIVLMQCNTNYTASLENFKYVNLNVLKTFQKLYPGIVLGLSDHTPGHAAVLGAVTLGVRMIEKHFTDDNDREGPDHKFAMNPQSWREMVNRTRELEFALGDGIKRIEDNEKQSIIVQRRAVRAAKDLKEGQVITRKDLDPLRPCPVDAIEPYNIDKIIGRTLNKGICAGEVLKWIDLR